jgi:hypothetical protein
MYGVYSQMRVKNSPKDAGRLSFVDRWEALDKYTAVMYMKEWNVAWVDRLAICSDYGPHLDRPGNEEENGILIMNNDCNHALGWAI